MKRCLVKADDYGFTEAISLGILKAYREGIVRSTGVMINMPAAPAALGWLREAEGLCLDYSPISTSNYFCAPF